MPSVFANKEFWREKRSLAHASEKAITPTNVNSYKAESNVRILKTLTRSTQKTHRRDIKTLGSRCSTARAILQRILSPPTVEWAKPAHRLTAPKVPDKQHRKLVGDTVWSIATGSAAP